MIKKKWLFGQNKRSSFSFLLSVLTIMTRSLQYYLKLFQPHMQGKSACLQFDFICFHFFYRSDIFTFGRVIYIISVCSSIDTAPVTQRWKLISVNLLGGKKKGNKFQVEIISVCSNNTSLSLISGLSPNRTHCQAFPGEKLAWLNCFDWIFP